MTVIKRDRKQTTNELVKAIEAFVKLLRNQGEEAAVRDLNKAAALLGTSEPGTKENREAIQIVIDAFDGEHELNSYTHTRKNTDEWTEADELSLASSRVLSLTRRMR